MFSLDRETLNLRNEGVLDDATAARLVALERREIVSLYGELRFLTWAGVMLIVAGVGVIVSKNLDKIGPLAIAVAIALASIACYAWVIWRRGVPALQRFRAGATPEERGGSSIFTDYVLLLGALLASSDIGFIEHQWHLLGAEWQRHFLVLAILHGTTAYIFNSRVLLSLSISALAAFLGIERRLGTLFSSTVDMALRAFTCAALVFAWRLADLAVRRRSRRDDIPAHSETLPFSPVFDHFATNLAFWGAVILTADEVVYFFGFLLTALFAALSLIWGRRVREELFVIYALVYGLIATNLLFFRVVKEPIVSMLFMIVTITAAIVVLFVVHMRMRQERT